MTPDDYLVSKVTGEVVREQSATRTIEYVAASRRAAARCASTSPRERRGSACLDHAAAGRAGRRWRAGLQRHFGCHQDIEWAIARDGRRCSCCSRAPSPASPSRPPQATAGVGDRAGDEHVRRRRGARGAPDGRSATRTSARSCASSTSPSSTSCGSRPRASRCTCARTAPGPSRPRPTQAAAAPRAAGGSRRSRTSGSRSRRRCSAPSTAPRRRGDAPFVEVGSRGRARHDRLHHRGHEDDELGARRGRPERSSRSARENGELVEYGGAAVPGQARR